MNCSIPGLPVHHQLLELTQTYVHRVTDAIQASHPLLSPSPPAFNLSQNQGLRRQTSLGSLSQIGLEELLKGHISPQVLFSDPNTQRMKQSFVKDFTSRHGPFLFEWCWLGNKP